MDRPVVGEERVRDAAEPGQGGVVHVDDGLVGGIAARQHDRAGGQPDQQVMQRRVGQHHAKLAVARRDRAGHLPSRQPRQQHNRPPAADQQRLSCLIDIAELAGGGSIRDHDREWLVFPVLAIPQRRRGALIPGVHRQVIAAQPLDGEHLPLPQQAGRRRQRLAGQRRPRCVKEPQPGAAGRAADRLRVEAPVCRVVVLCRAPRAHGEAGHRRQCPVVGHVADDREPRPAVRAVDERVAEPAVGRIGEFSQAVIACRGVSRHQGVALPGGVARRDGEP